MAASRRSINCKEAWAIIWACRKLREYLLWPKVSTIYYDHNNLKYIFDPSSTCVNALKSTMNRLSRQSWEISALPYKFVILSGTANMVADLLSHWGLSHRPCELTAKICLTQTDIQEYTDNNHSKCFRRNAQARSANSHEPSTIYELPHSFEWPSLDDMILSQKACTTAELKTMGFSMSATRY